MPVNKQILDFIPIVCHYNSTSLLTKDGQLIQTIKLEASDGNLRDEIRKTLTTIDNGKIAIYIYVIRSKEENEPMNRLSPLYDVNRQWHDYAGSSERLSNSLYISLVHAGLTLWRPGWRSISLARAEASSSSHLAAMHQELNNTTAEFARLLAVYRPRVLTVIGGDMNQANYSEPLSLYSYLLQLSSRIIPLVSIDATQVLSSFHITYDFNTIEINSNKHNLYAAIHSLKYPYDLQQESVESILSLANSFVLTEVIYPTNKTNSEWHKQKKIYSDLGHKEMIALGKLENIFKVKGCYQQLNITTFNSDYTTLLKQLDKLSETLKHLGIVAIREDFNVPAAFFSRIPGNGQHLHRACQGRIDRAAIFTNINSAQEKIKHNNFWSAFVTVFPDLSNNPIDFTFHQQGIPTHSIIVGENGAETLTNFLLAQALKFEPRIIQVSYKANNARFIQALGSEKLELDVELGSLILALMPLWPQSDRADLVLQILNLPADSNSDDYVILTQILSSIDEQSNLHQLRAELTKALQKARVDSAIVKLYEALQTAQLTETEIILPQILEVKPVDQQILGPLSIVKFLLQLSQRRDGQPTIITIDCFLEISAIAKAAIYSLLQRLKEMNVVVIATLEPQELAEIPLPESFHNNFTSCFLFTTNAVTSLYRELFSLNDEECELIRQNSQSPHLIFLRQQNSSSLVKFDLSSMPDLLALVS